LRQRGGRLTDGKPRSAFAVRLPGKPYLAIRVKPRGRNG
jgi:hypothetical protein